jgi:hypothetical protein
VNDDMRELRERIADLTDQELVEMVTVGAGDYRQEALDYARAELRSRGVDFSETQHKEEEAEADFDPFPLTRQAGLPESKCGICGGELRAGTLVADKELTIVFGDNREERFIKVTACAQCGQLSLVVDYDTSVGSYRSYPAPNLQMS